MALNLHIEFGKVKVRKLDRVSLGVIGMHAENIPRIRLVPTLQRGNSSGNAPALLDAGASLSAFPRRSVGTIGWGLFIASYLVSAPVIGVTTVSIIRVTIVSIIRVTVTITAVTITAVTVIIVRYIRWPQMNNSS